jgi:hypothetical protein
MSGHSIEEVVDNVWMGGDRNLPEVKMKDGIQENQEARVLVNQVSEKHFQLLAPNKQRRIRCKGFSINCSCACIMQAFMVRNMLQVSTSSRNREAGIQIRNTKRILWMENSHLSTFPQTQRKDNESKTFHIIYKNTK